MRKFRKGDLVTHQCGSPRGEMDAVFSHYIDDDEHNFDAPRVAVTYTNKARKTVKGREGDWLLKYCKFINEKDSKSMSPKEQNRPMPSVHDFPFKDDGTPPLIYFQTLYAWRGYNGLGRNYPHEKYYEWEKKKSTSHITDPVSDGRMKFYNESTERMELLEELRSNSKPKPKENMWGWCEDIIKEMDKKEHNKNQMFKDLYCNEFPISEEEWGAKIYKSINVGDTVCRRTVAKEVAVVKRIFTNSNGIESLTVEYPCGTMTDWFVCNTKLVATASMLGTQVHNIIEHKFNASRHNDFADALKYAHAYMSIDWAEGYNPESKMKAEIKTVYVNGLLVQTLINDRDVAEMDASGFLSQIGNAEGAILKLKKHKTKSVFAKQEIARLKKFVKTNYQLLDANFSVVD